MLKLPHTVAIQKLQGALGDLQVTSFVLPDQRVGVECLGPAADPMVGFGVLATPSIDPCKVEALIVSRFRRGGHQAVNALLDELPDLVARGVVGPQSEERKADCAVSKPWCSPESEVVGRLPLPLDEGLPIHGAAFGTDQESVPVPGATLFKVPSAMARWIGPWLAERFHVAQDRCPDLGPALQKAFDGLPRSFCDAVETFHLVANSGDQEVQSFAREIVLEGLPELYRRLEEAILPLDIGKNLKERVLRALQERPARLVHFFTEEATPPPELPETERDLKVALQARQGAPGVRAFWTEPSSLVSTRSQTEACGDLVAAKPNLRFGTLDEALHGLAVASRLGRIDFSKCVVGALEDAPFSQQTLAEQAASYAQFTGQSHLLVRPFAPLEIPEWVRPARVVSPDPATRQIEYDMHLVEQGYRTSIWRWPTAFFLLEGRPTTMWNEVRFHTKVHDNLGAVHPGFVVSRWISGADEKGRAIKWGEVLTSLKAGSAEVQSLKSEGADLREYPDGSVWVGIEQKKSFHDVNERLRRAFQDGDMNMQLQLQKSAALAKLVNACIHHEHLPHKAPHRAHPVANESLRREAM